MNVETVVVKDQAGKVVRSTYFEDEPEQRRPIHRVSHDEAVLIAQTIYER
ncbi:hypothetical protein [Methylobacterium iners]|nr:hypothetical protein [Methylobacterium iners]